MICLSVHGVIVYDMAQRTGIGCAWGLMSDLWNKDDTHFSDDWSPWRTAGTS